MYTHTKLYCLLHCIYELLSISYSILITNLTCFATANILRIYFSEFNSLHHRNIFSCNTFCNIIYFKMMMVWIFPWGPGTRQKHLVQTHSLFKGFKINQIHITLHTQTESTFTITLSVWISSLRSGHETETFNANSFIVWRI